MLIYHFQSNDKTFDVTVLTSANVTGDNNFSILDIQPLAIPDGDVRLGFMLKKGDTKTKGNLVTFATDNRFALYEIDTVAKTTTTLHTADSFYAGGLGMENIQ